MSAVAAYAEDDRIHLLADGAFYDGDGVLTDIRMKIWQIPGTEAVFSSRGSEVAFLAFALASAAVDPQGFDDLTRKLDQVWERFDSIMAGTPGEMIIAGWSHERAAPVLLFRHTIPAGRGAIDCEPGVTYLMGRRCGFGVDFKDLGDDWSSDRAVVAFERARQQRYDITYGEGAEPVMRYAIGGHVAHVEVSAQGISVDAVHHWPEDAVGTHIRPAALERGNVVEFRAAA